MRLPFQRDRRHDPMVDLPRDARRAGHSAANVGPATGDDAVAAARTKARRRLVGAAVLLAAGVIGFPLLFETEPRPLPPNLPIITAQGERVRAAPVPGEPGEPAEPRDDGRAARDGAAP
ncbi:MAG: hypothetical protein KIT17_26910, partial [Rubrivivax sp.]|nr:hypothetical protein [Rubrivivax sp.]